MIFAVKTSEHPSPPPVHSPSSVAKTIRRGEKKRGMKGGGRGRARQRERGLCGGLEARC